MHCIWFTGLSCAGKTTYANILAEKLRNNQFLNYKIQRLDGDISRDKISKDLAFNYKDRFENIRRNTFIAKLLVKNDVITVASFITPYNKMRDYIKKEIEEVGNYYEVFVDTSLETCIKRDESSLYTEALEGKIDNFTGISDPFEQPKNPDYIIKESDDIDQKILFIYREISTVS